MKAKFKISLLLFTFIMSISCEDYLEEEPPIFVSASNFWQTASDARTGVDGVYEKVNAMYERWMGTVDAYTDDIVSRTAGNSFTNPIGLHQVSPSDRLFEQVNSVELYTGPWTGITRANTVLQFVPNIDMDETEKNIILGEARALRAFYYYKLVKLWGDAPIITEAITTQEDFNKQRASVDIIYDEIIIPDLLFAEENCRDGLHTDGHITKWTAKVILAEVYMMRAGWRRTSQGEFVQGDPINWALARDKAKDIIDNSPHSLNTEELVEGTSVIPAFGRAWDYRSPFTAESMFEISYIKVAGLGSWYSRESNSARNGVGYWGTQANRPLLESDSIDLTVAQMAFTPPGPRLNLSGAYLVTPDLWDAFEEGDLRRDFSLMTRYEDVISEFAPRTILCRPTFRKLIDIEYYLGGAETNFQFTTANLILYRYADALLIYAEAQNEADGGPNAEAYAALNEIRTRAGLLPLDGLSQDDFRKAVWQERRVELNAEFKRKFDLMRTNRLVQETTDINLNWDVEQGSLTPWVNAFAQYLNNRTPYPDHEWLWPIPQTEMELNAENDWYQNEGY
ncbi:RagB/SusD family nutrient uptake outer membrane protein [uncultured Polaribacter sp.]|uniref:RagB/SusD family nutrient uptake outer membrane protein n=1 Tax=uncultured Polaribacter sp. TaxID=174711 RepID=UPI00262047B6|nr:RagB/SusD family nutrient uptake outer membrane protein [uncultured Polaribacter sp.]